MQHSNSATLVVQYEQVQLDTVQQQNSAIFNSKILT